MQKLLLLFMFIGGALFSQSAGYCKITKTGPDPSPKSKLTIKFVGPQGKPATSHLAFKMNNDTVIQPTPDKAGIYVMTLKPGTYTFRFFVKYWHDVDSKPIVLKPKTNTCITVKFEPEEIGSAPVK
ncbi:MAG: hypothetical protein ACXVPQ_00625 [Bacteroidia bacterium]